MVLESPGAQQSARSPATSCPPGACCTRPPAARHAPRRAGVRPPSPPAAAARWWPGEHAAPRRSHAAIRPAPAQTLAPPPASCTPSPMWQPPPSQLGLRHTHDHRDRGAQGGSRRTRPRALPPPRRPLPGGTRTWRLAVQPAILHPGAEEKVLAAARVLANGLQAQQARRLGAAGGLLQPVAHHVLDRLANRGVLVRAPRAQRMQDVQLHA